MKPITRSGLFTLLFFGIVAMGCKQPYLDVYEASNEFPEKGMVPDEATAKEIAFAMLKAIYGERDMLEQKPFKARIERGVWIVEGHFPDYPPMVGGSAFIGIRQKDGKVLFWGHTV